LEIGADLVAIRRVWLKTAIVETELHRGDIRLYAIRVLALDRKAGDALHELVPSQPRVIAPGAVPRGGDAGRWEVVGAAGPAAMPKAAART
jgi:hypothetical protein